MKLTTFALLSVMLGAANAYADLKPDLLDCNAKKAARNAAMEATVGVSGHCDTGKALKDTKEDTADKVKDAVHVDGDRDKPLQSLGHGDNKNNGLLKKNKD